MHIPLIILLCFPLKAQKDNSVFSIIDSLHASGYYKKLTKLEYEELALANTKESAKSFVLIADAYANLNKEDTALDYLYKALNIYEALQFQEQVLEVKRELFEILRSQKNLKINPDVYLNEIREYAQRKNVSKWLQYYYTSKGIELYKALKLDSARYYFKQSLSIPKSVDDYYSQNDLYSLMGSLYSGGYKKPDSALIYYDKALKIYHEDTINNGGINKKFNILNNIGNTFRRARRFDSATHYYKRAEKIDLPKFNRNSKRVLYNSMSATYYYMKDWEKAYDYLYKLDSIKDSINVKEQNIKISDITEQYDNEKLRADNLEIESKRKQNRNLLIGALAFILFGGTTFFLIQKNTKRKQLLAEQEKELQIQKVGTLMKEQELASIDAMIEGQEKERQRIANDLHDDLGGMMATVKLHFNTLKDKPSPKLYDKTNALLDEAYQKIRTIAHAKNSGVIAKEGLLKSVRDMAQKVSAPGKIDIEVIDHGLENRLENSLELSIFRMIQELITNVIKHANATEASIHLTQHDNSLNIMIEDNGKGFNARQVTKQKGMGLSSIDKRVDHLNGKLEIDSEIGRGTNIIIDIPI